MSREGQVWRLNVTDLDELIGLVVEDDGVYATLLVLLSCGIFRAPPGTLSKDEMRTNWESWRWERLS